MASANARDGGAPGALPSELLEEFARQGTTRSFPKGAVVVVEGEPAEAMYVVLEGTLTVYVDDEAGKVVELTRLGPGQYFGELMLGSTVRTASVIAWPGCSWTARRRSTGGAWCAA